VKPDLPSNSGRSRWVRILLYDLPDGLHLGDDGDGEGSRHADDGNNGQVNQQLVGNWQPGEGDLFPFFPGVESLVLEHRRIVDAGSQKDDTVRPCVVAQSPVVPQEDASSFLSTATATPAPMLAAAITPIITQKPGRFTKRLRST